MRGVLIPANSAEPITEVKLPDRLVAVTRELGKIISSDPDGPRVWPERVHTGRTRKLLTDNVYSRHEPCSYPTVTMHVDEDGHRKRLPWNERATMLYNPGDSETGIVGNAVLLGELWYETRDPEATGPDYGDLPDEVTVERVLHAVAK